MAGGAMPPGAWFSTLRLLALAVNSARLSSVGEFSMLQGAN